jgi:hypothetical protein
MANLTVSDSAPGREVFTSSEQHKVTVSTPIPAPTPVVEEEDDPSAAVNLGVPCRRNGCKVSFVSDEVNRQGDGKEAVCMYHPGSVRGYFNLLSFI